MQNTQQCCILYLQISDRRLLFSCRMSGGNEQRSEPVKKICKAVIPLLNTTDIIIL